MPLPASILQTAVARRAPDRQGKVRDIYEFGDRLLIVATDRISAFDYVLGSGIPDKGKVLTQISSFWFERTKDIVPNHVISTRISDYPKETRTELGVLNGRSMLVRLTPEGRTRFLAMAAEHESWLVSLFDGFDQTQREQLHTLLKAQPELGEKLIQHFEIDAMLRATKPLAANNIIRPALLPKRRFTFATVTSVAAMAACIRSTGDRVLARNRASASCAGR